MSQLITRNESFIRVDSFSAFIKWSQLGKFFRICSELLVDSTWRLSPIQLFIEIWNVL